jgi:hypothetical protein
MMRHAGDADALRYQSRAKFQVGKVATDENAPRPSATGFQMFEAFDRARHRRDRAFRTEPGQCEFDEHHAEVAQCRAQQVGALGRRQLRQAQFEVALGDVAAFAGQPYGQEAEHAAERTQGAIRQLPDQPDHAQTDPGRPATWRQQADAQSVSSLADAVSKALPMEDINGA